MNALTPPPSPHAPTSTWVAPAHWRCVEWVSDLHLHPDRPELSAAWAAYLAQTQADAVFILGDWVDAWVGDDALADPFEAALAQQMRQASAQRAFFFIAGNRDFLFGRAAERATGVQRLPDPLCLHWAGQRWLLSHGDALCVADVAYQRVRQQTRNPAWQQTFLAQPLAQRRAQVAAWRAQSQARKASGAVYADVDAALCLRWLAQAQASHLIHGHTHRPGCTLLAAAPTAPAHPLAGPTASETPAEASPGPSAPARRWCLPDWEPSAQPPRGGGLRLHRGESAPVPFGLPGQPH